MKLFLTIFFLSISYCYSQAQIKYVKGISVSGKDANYTATALPMGTTTQTATRHLSDSMKTIYRWVIDQARITKEQGKTINILRDSIKILTEELNEADTTSYPDFKVDKIRKHFTEVKNK